MTKTLSLGAIACLATLTLAPSAEAHGHGRGHHGYARHGHGHSGHVHHGWKQAGYGYHGRYGYGHGAFKPSYGKPAVACHLVIEKWGHELRKMKVCVPYLAAEMPVKVGGGKPDTPGTAAPGAAPGADAEAPRADAGAPAPEAEPQTPEAETTVPVPAESEETTQK